MNAKNDIIELSLPFKADYAGTARLTASGVANRMGFDIETIEDIKVAISEVCSRLIKMGSASAASFKIVFVIGKDALLIRFECEDKSLKCIFSNADGELGVAIITALMDNVELCTSGKYLLSMSKTLKGKM